MPKQNHLRIALFHSALDTIGGAEVVCLKLARHLPADLYTTNIDHGKIAKMGFSDIKPISIGQVPRQAPFRHQAILWRFSRLNLRQQYDKYIIGGDWAVSAAKNHKPNIWYAHSGLREIWDLQQFVREKHMGPLWRPLFDIWTKYNQKLNRRYVDQVQTILCNSQNTQNRINHYLERQAAVAYPPTDTTEFYWQPAGDFWLSVNRLTRHKRIEVQLEAFRQMPDKKLIIVGSFERARHFKNYVKYIKSLQPSNVEIRHAVDQPELLKLYAGCRGVISTALDEDLGLTAVEAMAAGKPIIAPQEGGYRETVLHDQTGLLLKQAAPKTLQQAVGVIDQDPDRFREATTARAKKFDTQVFIKQTSEYLTKPSLDYRNYQPGDEIAICRLFKHCFNEAMTLTKWQAKYQSQLLNKSPIIATNPVNEIVAHLGILTKKVKVGSELINAYEGVDSLVHRSYRGQGVWHQLLNIMIDQTQNGLLWGCVSRQLAHYQTKHPKVRSFNLIKLEKKIINASDHTPDLLAKKITRPTDFRSIDQIWQVKSHELNISQIRDQQFIQSIKTGTQGRGPTDLIFNLEQNHQSVGYFVLKASKQGQPGYLYDLLILNRHLDSRILETIEATAQANNINQLKVLTTDPLLLKLLQQAGYRPTGQTESFVTNRPDLVTSLEDIYLTYADFDYVS